MSLLTIISSLIRSSSGGGGTTQLSKPVLSISQNIGNDVVLDCDDITSATSYTFQRSQSSDFSSGVTSSTSATSDKTFTNLATGTWYFRVKATGAGHPDSNYSNSVSIPIDVPFSILSIPTGRNKTVKAGGTIGVDCDYTTVTDALHAITTAGSSSQYAINLLNGTLTDVGEFEGAFGFNIGITLKHYIHIIGQSRAGTIINGAEAASSANEVLVDTFHIPATMLIQRATINAHNCKYAFHNDYNSGNYEYDLYVKDCNVNHVSSVIQPPTAVGCGMYGNQKVVFIDCDFTGADGFYAHGTESTTRDLAKHFEVTLIRCNLDKFEWHDFEEYAANKLTLIDCTIGEVILNAYSTIYDANPGNPVANQGFKQFIQIIASGNTVTTVTRNAEAAAILGSSFSSPSDFV